MNIESKFFTFIKPYLTYIDSGDLFKKPFVWLYTLLSVGNLFVPVYIMYEAVDNDVFDGQFKEVSTFLLIWLIIAFASWVSFQIWWDRRRLVNQSSTSGDEFVATPVYAHLIQTMGEWLGTWVAIVGSGSALLTAIILGEDGQYLMRSLGMDFLGSGLIFVLVMPLIGFLIVVGTRFLAELFRSLAAIANNTRRT